MTGCCRFSRPPRYVLLRCPKSFARCRSQDFDRCHSFLLAASAAGGARKRPRFGNPPCMLTLLRDNDDMNLSINYGLPHQ